MFIDIVIKLFVSITKRQALSCFQHRMAGNLIAMLRVLRLKPPLQATVTSPEFKQLNMFVEIARIILNENVWVWLILTARGVYAMMQIL